MLCWSAYCAPLSTDPAPYFSNITTTVVTCNATTRSSFAGANENRNEHALEVPIARNAIACSNTTIANATTTHVTIVENRTLSNLQIQPVRPNVASAVGGNVALHSMDLIMDDLRTEAVDAFDADVGLFFVDALRTNDVEEGEIGVVSDDALLPDIVPYHTEHL